ncbi:BCCT family transporter [Chromohalobacter canadensis]|uniref:BCCT family transporter n=1 Tax=Chromohalobacter moromii TaxID=2860329 RepID=A0A9X2X147_9GAMM|nr:MULTISPECIES: BCCT family transporter [Chromohalobacter]MCT8468360.1 BCCT family transporter [Chromohalobacter canadensis]MCT8471415.1 BCCT family transporter [Chromohalobacter canadensis]MCT8498868.1 BCCT family transporter [Chromohalobacter canadensis]MCT8504766.1 BCCT family transporter [Chromohalobacter moromii]
MTQHEASATRSGTHFGDPTVMGLTIGFIILFVAFSLIDANAMTAAIGVGFAWTAKNLGAYFQLLLLLTFFIAVGVAVSPAGRARIGNRQRPDMGTFKWVSIILCTLLGGGGVFFAAGEPIYHFVVTPPAFSSEPGTSAAVPNALAQSFMHWGFHAWAVLGTLAAIVLSHHHYDRGLPLQPRTLLAPLLGEARMRGVLGGVVDAVCVIAVVAGTVGPIGFLATQMNFGLHTLFGVAEGYGTQLMILVVLGGVYVTSAITGIDRGIQFLSRCNVMLALAIGAAILLFGPTQFLFDSWFQGFGTYLGSFFEMATMTSQAAPDWWMKWWTVFFFAWFIGYAPLMAIFIARISRGRTIRQLVVAVAVLAPVATSLWFTLLGGSGIFYQMSGAIDLSEALKNFQFDVATLAVAQALPGGSLMALAILMLTTIFVATTGDSMSYAVSVVNAGHDDPQPALRAFWGVAMALMAAILLYMGEGQISVLQQFIVITAFPVSLVLLPTLWLGPRAAQAMAKRQGIVAS